MVDVQVELHWGKRWTGSHYETTPGQGVYVTVLEYRGNSFSGCPCGRTDDCVFESDDAAIEYAIADFINYGKFEFLGDGKLTRDRINIAVTVDYRKEY